MVETFHVEQNKGEKFPRLKPTGFLPEPGRKVEVGESRYLATSGSFPLNKPD